MGVLRDLGTAAGVAARERLVKALGGVPATGGPPAHGGPPGPPPGGYMSEARIEAAAERSGMDASRPFSPGEPMRPADGYSDTPRTRDYPTGFNISSRPRMNEQVNFSTLRGMVNAYDIAQICIWHRIDSVRSLEWNVHGKKGDTGDVDKAIALGRLALAKPDRELSFKAWLAKYLFDVLAFDAGTLYRMRNGAGQAVGLRVLDGTMIAPLQDYWGNRPTGDSPAFVQFAQGVPWEWLLNKDLVYEPFRPQSTSPYGKAPLETILLNANTDLRFQTYFLSRFTEGNVPEGFAGSPEGWSPDQIRDYQDAWDALLYGDDAAKHQIKWVPHGTSFTWSNEQKFDDGFSLFLMRKTAAAFHVVPADLGFTEDVNRSSGETQADVQFRVGDLPLIDHMQEILTRFLQDDLGLPLVFSFDTGKETEDRLATAQADEINIKNGVISASEIRQKRYGLSEPDGVPVPRFIYSSRSGPIPLSALYAVAGPVDGASAAPVPGSELPTSAFTAIEGTAPAGQPDRPALAVVRYPAQNAALGPAPAPAQLPVAKAETTGITEATGAYGTPMLTDDGHEDEDDAARAAVRSRAEVLKAEVATFRRFLGKRRRAGVWRDFAFAALPAGTARELNRAGRVLVSKDTAAGPAVAGLAVRAADTGRVLMLQRAANPVRCHCGMPVAWDDLDGWQHTDGSIGHDNPHADQTVSDLVGTCPPDPAGGTWEFPGGHIEAGEQPFVAAVREWQEETGCHLPVEAVTWLAYHPDPAWVSPNGVYAGYVVTISAEAAVPVRGAALLANPDDPDGDCAEAIAWTDPAHLDGHAGLRPELAADLPRVLAALAPLPDLEGGAGIPTQGPPDLEGPVVGENPPAADNVDHPVLSVEEVVKADPKDRWSGHPTRRIEETLAGYHGPRIQAGLAALVDEAQLRAFISSYLAGRS